MVSQGRRARPRRRASGPRRHVRERKGGAQRRRSGGCVVSQGRRQGGRRGPEQPRLDVREGRGVAKDDTEAVAWFRKAAGQGNALAQNNLGLDVQRMAVVFPRTTLRRLRGFAKPPTRATPLPRFNLGSMYESGRGVPKDDTEAVAWYRKAADQGNRHGPEQSWRHVQGRPWRSQGRH